MLQSNYIGSHHDYKCPRSQELESEINFMSIEMNRLYQDNVFMKEQVSSLQLENTRFRKIEESLSKECRIANENNSTLSNKFYVASQNEKKLIARLNESEQDQEKLRSCVFQFIFRLKSSLLSNRFSQSELKTDAKDNVRLSVVMKELEDSLKSVIKQTESCTCSKTRLNSNLKIISVKSNHSSIKSYKEYPLLIDEVQRSTCKTSSTNNNICDFKCSCSCKCHTAVSSSIEVFDTPHKMVINDKLEIDGEAYINRELSTEEDVNPELGNLNDEDLAKLRDEKLIIDVNPACAIEPALSEDMLIEERHLDSVSLNESSKASSRKVKLSKSKISQIKSKLESKKFAMNSACPDSTDNQNDAQFRATSNSQLKYKNIRSSSTKDQVLVDRLSSKKDCIHTFEYFYGNILPFPKK